MFGALRELADHPVGQVYAALARDRNPNKLDLGIGVYRDASGRCPVMASVQKAQHRLVDSELTKEYRSPDGNWNYCRHIEKLVLGASHPALAARRVLTVQTPGAGGGLRAGAELIQAAARGARIWLPAPTWEHQQLVFRVAGLKLAEYPYYDRQSNRLLFDEMIATLRKAEAGDIVLLHGCCHNPSGEDLSQEQWRALSTVVTGSGLVPFVDLAYQGFADGIDEDVFGARLLAATVPEMILVSSSSKSFGIYRERAGTVSLIFSKPGREMTNAARHLSEVTRSLYFMPPDTGAAIVAEILADEALSELWRRELDAMRGRIIELRASLSRALASQISSGDFEYLARQKGMFSLLPLSSEALSRLQTSHSIYMMPDARINVAAVTEANVTVIAKAIADVLTDEREGTSGG
jgi:aspartate aminotransferase